MYPSVARNRGVQEAKGSVIVFLDADVVVTAEWLLEIEEVRRAFPSRWLMVTGDQYHISSRPSWIEDYWFEPLRAGVKDYINGGNLVISRRLFDEIGGFDATLETGEDVDICRRARERGAEIVFNGSLVALHEGFPKTAAHFVRRERWHGKGDFSRISRFFRSRVALVAAAFTGAHVLLIVGLGAAIAGRGSIVAIVSASAVVCMCVGNSAYRFGFGRICQLLVGAVISYLYFFGRALSLLDALGRAIFVAIGAISGERDAAGSERGGSG